MKNSYTAALVIISVAATAIYMDSKSQEDIVQREELPSDNAFLKDVKADVVAEQLTKTITDKKEVFKLSENKPNDAALVSGDKNDKPSFITGGSKALNSKVVRHHLEVTDFQSVIASLSQFQTVEEIEREHELAQAINNDSNLSIYPNNYSCGKGICAVELSDISDEELVNVNKLIPKTMNFKAITSQTIAMADGTNSIRVIGGSSPETNSMTFN